MYISEVTWLDKGHYIIHSGGITYDDNGMPVEKMTDGKQRKADIVEIKAADPDAPVSPESDVVYELKLDQNSFRSERMDVYAPDEKFTLGEPGQLLGQLDTTPVTKEEITIPDQAAFDQSSLKDTVSDFRITNEPDRLLVEGKIANASDKTKVFVILKGDNGAENKVYNVVSPSLYLQISKTGLSGNYQIWLMLDDKVIDTGEKIKF